jgi:biotin carboxyl carrier protein
MSLRAEDPPDPEGEFHELNERLIVSPGWGHIHGRRVREGRLLALGAVIGEVRAGRVRTLVRSPEDGVFLSWLVAEGDTVDAGRRLARLRPRPGTTPR